ncbi:MAG: aldehyde dehydrogenase family protein [Gemmatimonadota bacterium]|nr:MAG: aldehyde dehydrogenase family protein [Gemmatimonadota bacterium]
MRREFKLLIGEERRESSEKMEVRNPYNDEVVGIVHKGAAQDIDDAIEKAVRAFEVTRRMASHQRSEILHTVAQRIQERRDEFARTICLEAGKTITDSRIETDRAVNTFTIAAEEAKRVAGEVIPLDLLPASANRLGMTRRFPLGPMAGISPFNFPLNLVAHKVAPCIASGNTIVVKPASTTPMTALLLGEVVVEAGMVDGGMSVVPCPGSAGEPLVTDARLKKLTFTGSAEIGWYLKSKAVKKKVTLELGGNAGAIVHTDADLDYAVPRLVRGSFAYAGQICISVQRIFVHKDIYQSFIERFVEETAKLRRGDPIEETTDLSPMIDEPNAIRAETWVNEAVEGGATVMTGGQREGTYYEPTVLVDTRPEMKVNCMEVFAPIVTITPYDRFEEAVAGVNDSDFGLQAGVFTRDVKRIFYAYDNIDVGGLIVNDFPTYRIDHMPYGGVKDSGFGREGLRYAIEEMTELKLLALNLA